MPARWWMGALALTALAGCASDATERDDVDSYYEQAEESTLTPEESAARAPSDGPGEGARQPEIQPGVSKDVPFGSRDTDSSEGFLYPEGEGKTFPGTRAPEEK